jgi:hypothetical protein
MPESVFLITGTYILNDDIFRKYTDDGGHVGSNDGQREAAYMIAEQQACDYLKTSLGSATVTGTFPWPHNARNRVMLPYTYIQAAHAVSGLFDPSTNCEESEYSACARLIQPDHGILDLNSCGDVLRRSCSCSGYGGHGGQGVGGYPFIKFRIAYTMGLPDHAASHPSLRMGLVTAAKLALEQIIDPGGAEGGPGDPGVKSFSDTGYSETRDGLKMTSFGMSPLANYAARMLEPFKIKRALSLRLR